VAITSEVGLGGYGGRNQARLGWEMKKKRARDVMSVARQAAQAVLAVREIGRPGLSTGGDRRAGVVGVGAAADTWDQMEVGPNWQWEDEANARTRR
jgi:hypothetical protein